MVGVIVISESRASRDMLSTVKKVLGKKILKGVVPLTLKASLACASRVKRIKHVMDKLKTTGGVLIFTELFGSTQNNVCVKLTSEYKNIQVVCGYNLPMLIKAASYNESASLSEITAGVLDSGQKYIKSFK